MIPSGPSSNLATKPRRAISLMMLAVGTIGMLMSLFSPGLSLAVDDSNFGYKDHQFSTDSSLVRSRPFERPMPRPYVPSRLERPLGLHNFGINSNRLGSSSYLGSQHEPSRTIVENHRSRTMNHRPHHQKVRQRKRSSCFRVIANSWTSLN